LPSVVVLDTAAPESDSTVAASDAVEVAAHAAVLVLAEQPAPR
jgi:hypothetical protein